MKSFKCFSKSNIDVEITKSFQFIYVFIDLKNKSDHCLGIKWEVEISDQSKQLLYKQLSRQIMKKTKFLL